MKHLIRTTILMLAILLPAIVHAHNFEVDGIYYNINGKEATVTYKGIDIDSYSNEYSGSITIPATVTYGGTTYSVTAIGTYAFWSCDSLTNIDIPNSITNIEGGAFQCCYGLTSINIPNSVTHIGDGAFSDCYGLTSINIPNSVTSIGEGAFYYCYNLTYINIPNSVTAIGNNAFSITDWDRNQPDGLVYAGLVAYEYKGTMPEETSITLKEGTTGIAGGAFENCHSLTNINIPNSVTYIGKSAFYNCSNLTNIDIPNSVTSIEKNAFYGCSYLTNIKISNSVTAIGDNAFYGTVWYSNQPDGLVYAGLVAYKYKGIMPEGTSITLKEGTTGITSKAFYGCSSLTSINIPNSVTYIGDGAFWNCNGLTDINLPNSITNISDEAFLGCSGLTNINIPNSVTHIGGPAFLGCSGLTSINIPNSVTYIGGAAFLGCSGLTSINIPNSVTYIGGAAFSGCSGLTSINIPNSVPYIEDDTFSDCFNLINVYLSSSINTIVHHAFNGCDSIMNVYCFAATPPVVDSNTGTTFTSTRATLHVPAASLGVYFMAPISDYFENIVGDAIETTGISISRDSVEIQSGEQIKLNATVTPANASCKEVIWYSTDPNVATVENGIVTAVGYGECDIFAYCMGMPAICHISVTNRISLEQQEAMLLPNHMLVLNPTAPIMPAGFTVTSSDPTVAAARVMNGKVQIVGIKEGTATITVTSSDGTAQPATCLVTVYTEPGDMNCDGFVRISDVTALINYLLSGDDTGFKVANADLNNDSKVSIADVTALINILLTTETE